MNDILSHSDSPEIVHKLKIEGLCLYLMFTDEVESAIQSAEVQASWHWDEEYKAECITIDSEKHIASRITSDGRHPCVLASEPLTSQKDCFRVKVDKVGRFIGIGKTLSKNLF